MVFNHIIFLRRIWVIAQMEGISRDNIDREVLRDDFHIPLLEASYTDTRKEKETRCIEMVYLADKWWNSKGAKWYRKRAKKLRIRTRQVGFTHASFKGVTAAVKLPDRRFFTNLFSGAAYRCASWGGCGRCRGLL